jgi:uncharacterized protein VirK/YbjX
MHNLSSWVPTGLTRLPPCSFAGIAHRGSQCLNLITNFGPFITLFLLFSRRENVEFISNHSEVLFKFLGKYLAWNLSTAERIHILINHYHLMVKAFTPQQIHMLSRDGIPIWCNQIDCNEFSIRLFYSDGYYMEGELALSFCCQSAKLYNMAFTFAPGQVLGQPDGNVIIIGASQGVAGMTEQIRRAARAHGEIAPPAMLIIALQSMAAALRIETIVGISSQEQVSRPVHSRPQEHLSSYDELWESNGGIKINGFYHLPKEIHEKPMALVSRSHRSRARQKRALKREVFDLIFNNIAQLLAPSARPGLMLAGSERIAEAPEAR